MANDYSAVVLPELLLNIEQIFAESKRHELTLFEEPRTAVALLENQTATLDPIFKMDGGDYRCTGFSVAYQQADQNTIGSGGAEPTPDCVIAPDQTFSGLKETYDITRYFSRKIQVLGKDCDSAIKFRTRLAEAMMVKMHELALEVNQWAIATLVANKQTATNTGEYGTGIVGGVVQYPKADIQDATLWQSRLADWYLIGMQELLPASMFAVNGTNFWNAQYNAGFNAANDDQRSQALALAAFPNYWDVHGFGVSRANILDTSFLIDRNAYVFMTRNQYSETAVNMMDANNSTVFSMPLRYVDMSGAVQTMMYKLNGVMTPVMVDCRLQYVCDNTNTVDGFPTYNYNLEMVLPGDFKIAPNQASSTGIVQIDAV